MTRFADIRTEWRVEQIERDIRGKADQDEIHTLSSNVDSLERANREISAVVDGLRYELEALKDQVRELTHKIQEN